MARTEVQTRQLFDEWAKSYHADLLDESGPLMGYQRSVLMIDDALPLKTSSQVLDIGIGSGVLAKRLANRGVQITGIDISEKMLAVCQEQNPDFTLHVGTFNSIPASDGTFDAVVSGFAFHETPFLTRDKSCQEMARVLKSDGYLCLLDIMFASRLAMQDASRLIANEWDENEDYAIVGDLDMLLRQNDFTALKWTQTAPFHWMVIARKA